MGNEVGDKVVSVLIFNTELSRVALIKKKRPAWLAGKWTAIGGHIEETDADSWAAAIREAREECGLDITLEGGTVQARMIASINRGVSLCTLFAVTHTEIETAKTLTDEQIAVFSSNLVINNGFFVEEGSYDLLWMMAMSMRAFKDPKGKHQQYTIITRSVVADVPLKPIKIP